MEGLELKIARLRAGLKQWELASKLGITQNQLSLYELGRKTVPFTIKGEIRKILGMEGPTATSSTGGCH